MAQLRIHSLGPLEFTTASSGNTQPVEEIPQGYYAGAEYLATLRFWYWPRGVSSGAHCRKPFGPIRPL